MKPEERIETLERELLEARTRLALLEVRLYRVENGLPAQPAPPAFVVETAPPVQAPPAPAEPARPFFMALPEENEPPAPKPSQEPRARRDLEMELGSKVLPWVGALVVLVGLGFLTAIGIERRLFTPPMQFVGALLLSAAFLVTGYLKREERQDFGRLLMGIGSSGVYLSLAGGYFVHSLFSGPTLIAGFMVWSLLNLLFGAKTGSKSFVGLGFLGGIIGSLFATQRADFALQCGLHFLVVVPCLMVVVRRNWATLLLPGWLLGLGALAYGAQGFQDLVLYGAILGVHALLFVAANLLTKEPPAWMQVLPPLALGSVALLIFPRQVSYETCGVVLATGVAGIALAVARRGHNQSLATAVASCALAFLLSPIGLPAVPQAAVQLGVALLGTAVSFRWKYALYLGGAALALAVAPIADVAVSTGSPLELPLLGLAALTIIALGFATVRQVPKEGETVFVLGALMVWAVALRAGVLVVPSSAFLGFQIACISAVLGILLLARKDWEGAPYAAGLPWIFSLFTPLSLPRSEVLLGLGLCVPVTALLYGRLREFTRQESRGSLALVMGLVFATVCTSWINLCFGQFTALPFKLPAAELLVGLGFAFGAYRSRLGEPGALGLFLTLAAVAELGAETGNHGARLILGVFSVLALVVSWLAADRDGFKTSKLSTLLLGWLVASNIAWWTLHDSLGLSYGWSVSIGWGCYAGLLLVLGARADRADLRHAGLFGFASTLSKVLGYDLLLKVDPLLRVAVLLALGVALLTGGYYYIRRQRALE